MGSWSDSWTPQYADDLQEFWKARCRCLKSPVSMRSLNLQKPCFHPIFCKQHDLIPQTRHACRRMCSALTTSTLPVNYKIVAKPMSRQQCSLNPLLNIQLTDDPQASPRNPYSCCGTVQSERSRLSLPCSCGSETAGWQRDAADCSSALQRSPAAADASSFDISKHVEKNC